MRLYLLFFLILLGCSTTKTVLICGDHECINKKEAQQFFDENLTIEVKIQDAKKEKFYDLVQLNIKDNNIDQINITIKEKKYSKKKIIKKLSKKEKSEIEKKIKEKKLAQKKLVKVKKKEISEKKVAKIEKTQIQKITTKPFQENVCQILEKCDIDSVTEYLTKLGMKKKYPNINIK